MLRKILVLAITAFQVLVFGSLIVWRVVGWNHDGWAGMAYNIDTEVEREVPVAVVFASSDSRRVEMVSPGTPADRAGVAVGDRVVSVNGIPVADIDRLEKLADLSRTGDELGYLLETEHGARDVTLTLEAPYRHPLVVSGTATSVIAGAVFLLISMLVYWSRPRSRVALVFFLMCVFGAAEYLAWAVVEFDLPSLRGIAPATVEPFVFLGLGLVGFFAVALVNTLLHLSLIFPRPRPVIESWPRVVVWIHTLPFLLVAVVLAMIAVAFATRVVWLAAVLGVGLAASISVAALALGKSATAVGWWSAVKTRPLTVLALVLSAGGAAGFGLRLLPDPWKPIVLAVASLASFLVSLLFIVVFSILIVVTLYRSYRDSGVDEKRQVRWPLWGTLTAVGASVVLMVVSMVMSLFFGTVGAIDFTTNVVLTAASKMVYLLVPISLAFGIVKYRLMEIDVIIRKTVVYSAVTGFVLVVYLMLAGISGLALVRSAGLESQAATVVATLLVVALFVPVRNRAQRIVDRSFFRRERDTEASIGRITETVMEATALDGLALGVAEEVQRALGCRTVAVMVQRSGSDHLAVEATVGLPDNAAAGLSLTEESPMLRLPTAHVVGERDDLTSDEVQMMRQLGAERAVICRRGDDPVGLVTVGRKLSREPYDDADEVFLEAVAGQLAIGLGRLRGRRVELEFAQALQIQRSLLPDEIPQIAGIEVSARWQPAREVSGDYYDVLRLADDRLALCIGDVVGKGMPAALLMSSLQAAVKAVATAGADPAVVCDQVRSVVTSNLTGGKFVTFFYAVVDGATRRLSSVNCGHNPPVLARADGSVERLTTGGPAFARLMLRDGYTSADLELHPRDRLVLFTDGVSEAADPAGEQYGEDRIVGLVREHRDLSAGDLERTLTDTVLAHAGGELQDDLTLVVVAME
jgi:serine phosphatase RsbU (regulator of sigma subunit)